MQQTGLPILFGERACRTVFWAFRRSVFFPGPSILQNVRINSMVKQDFIFLCVHCVDVSGESALAGSKKLNIALRQLLLLAQQFGVHQLSCLQPAVVAVVDDTTTS